MLVSASSLLVACVGNVLRGDDGFGVAVARRLERRAWPAGVDIRDFGIRGIDFFYALLDGYGAAILVDVVARGGQPGRLYVIEPDAPSTADAHPLAFDAHRLDPAGVMGYVHAMGGCLHHFRVVGCEPALMAADDEPKMGLSEAVEAAVGPAVELVAHLVDRTVQALRAVDGSACHA